MKFNKTLFLTIVLPATIFSHSVFAEKITGNYLGYYSLTMNAHKDNGIGGQPWPSFALQGKKYMTLGSTIKDGVWRWDFDNDIVTIGGSTIFAMSSFYVPFQAFNLSEIENKKQDKTITISAIDEVRLPLNYDESTDLYSIRYAQKMYVKPPIKVDGVKDYPIGESITSFHVVKNSSDIVSISTADVENGIEPDGVPGTRLASVFPAIVQIEYNAPNMVVDSLKDSNTDGISDAMAKLLYLDPSKTDTDGDGLDDIIETPAYIRGKDSDADGLSDAHESGDYANNTNILSGVSLQYFRNVSIYSVGTDSKSVGMSKAFFKPFDISISPLHTLVGELPPGTNTQGKTLNYKLGNVGFMFDNNTMTPVLPFKMIFDQQPVGLEIYRIKKGLNFTTGRVEQSFEKIQWKQVNPNEISINISSTPGFPNEGIEFIFATTEDLKVPPVKPTDPIKPTDPAKPTDPIKPTDPAKPTKSGGSLDWWSLLICGLLTIHRRVAKV
ncbi:GlyGly-CTERM sorting domain-containing protein [Moritella viscosa]|nr:GlyGly-CTERM sorting domain-containing protein [Moritella viscosa]CED58816.1 putative uncharacterized protein [Moritella viscosa]SGY84444.1 Putative uncharacterized protein [Moritella viscosa]